MARLLLGTSRSKKTMIKQVKSTCCYCGVGCGLLIETENERIVGVRGDPAHPGV